MALEQRFMFDGAAVADAITMPEHADATGMLRLATPERAQPAALANAQTQAERLVVEFFQTREARNQAFELFSGGQTGEPSARWLQAFDQLIAAVQSGSESIRVELRTAAELQGMLGAFTAMAGDGQPTIYLNADHATSASTEALQAVLLEEIGHAIDFALNGTTDSLGDEGHAFAALILNGDANLASVIGENDQLTLTLDGRQIEVETAAPYGIAQTTYVPLPESDVQTALKAISSSVTGNIQTVIALSATGNGTIVVYDHWEDGYEADINNPIQSTTQIWGDGNTANGTAPGMTNDLFNAGQTILLSNAVNPASPNSVDYDGRDKIGSTKAISVTKAGWSATPGTVLAGAVAVIDSANAGKSYTLPIGQNVETVATGTNKLFEYTSAHIIATQNGTTVTIDRDGNAATTTDITSVTLNEGQTYLVNGGLNAGAKITADKGIGVYLIAGDVGSAYENRWFALTPDEQWSGSYYAPVSTTLAADPAYVILYNPGSSAITVKYDTATQTGLSVTVNANSTGHVLMPASAAHFYTTTGAKFFAVSVIDADATSNATHDWSYSLVPESYLTDKFIVAWGPGNNNSPMTGAANGSPVWVTAMGNTTLYVDNIADVSKFQIKDAVGNLIAGTRVGSTTTYSYAVSALQSYRFFDNSDNDQSGMTVYTKDGTLITGAWGEDPSIAGAGNPYLDMGTTVLPFPDYVFTKTSKEANPSDANTNVELGEQVEYTLTIVNRSVIEMFAPKITDSWTPATAVNYVANSATLTVYDTDGTTVIRQITDLDGNSDLFPLNLPGTGGYTLADVNLNLDGIQGVGRGQKIVVTYKLQLPNSSETTKIGELAGNNYQIDNSAQLDDQAGTTKQSINLTSITTSITDGELSLYDSSFTSRQSSYTPGNTIGLQVGDSDQNKSSTVAETLTVTVTNNQTHEVEVRTLTETGVDTGIFRGTLLTSSSAATTDNDGTLKLSIGNTFQVEYTDPTTGSVFDNPTAPGISGSFATGNANVQSAAAISNITPTDGLAQFYFDGAYTKTSGNLTEGGTLYLQVTDGDQNLSSGAMDTLTVKVSNITTSEIETVTLTETGVNSGIFRGTLASSSASAQASNNSGTLKTVSGDSLKVEYTDPITGSSSDNPTTPGTLANTDTAAVAKIKVLYLSDNTLGADGQSGTDDDGLATDLDRILPTGATAITSAALVPTSQSGSYYYYDKFSTKSYASTGTTTTGTSGYTNKSWTTRWTETGDDGSRSTGVIRTTNSDSSLINTGSTALVFTGNSGDADVQRSIDLSGVDTSQAVNLSFSYWTNQLNGTEENVQLKISVDGGSTWTTLQTFTGDSGSETSSYSNNIKDYLTGSSSLSNIIIKFDGNKITSAGSQANFQIDNLLVKYKTANAVIPVTFGQNIPMAEAFSMPAGGVVNVVTHVSSVSGLGNGTSYAGITATLNYEGGSSGSIVTLTGATYDSSAGTLTWSGTLASGVTIPQDASVKLVVSNTQAGSSFKIDYDSASKPSRIELPTSTVIDIVDVDGNSGNGVQEIGFYDQSMGNGGGALITANSIDAGGIVYLRVKVKDPFGDYDITALKLAIDGPGINGDIGTPTPVGTTVVNADNDGTLYKTFEYVWQTINNTGNYTLTVTAKEGYEDIVDTATGNFVVTARDLGTPSVTTFITGLGGTDAGATYAVGAAAFLRVADLDENTNAAAVETVTASLNGATVTLTETGINTGIFETALSAHASLIQGVVLSASYTDNDDATDVSADVISVPNPTNSAPTATPNVRTVNENASATGTNLITSNEGSGLDSDPNSNALTVIAINGNAGAVGTTLTLPSGATVLVAADGSYTYNPNGAFNFLAAGANTTDSFSYTISDGNGGTSTATATITINGLADPSATVTDSNGSALGDNSIAENAGNPVTGTFTLTAPAGLKEISVGASVVSKASLQAIVGAQAATHVSIGTGKGTLVLNGYASGTGVVSYRYQQTGLAKSHTLGDQSIVDSIAVTITDDANTTVTAESIDILISDTSPIANADARSVTEGTTASPTANLSGNVLANGSTGDVADTQGADTPVTVTKVIAGNATPTTAVTAGSSSTAAGITVSGTYGQLVIGADGSYSYDLNDDNATVNALNNSSPPLTETFSYAVTDADGDSSTTTLTLTINGANDAPVAANNSYTTAFNTLLTGKNIISNGGATGTLDSDAEGDTFTVAKVNNVAFSANGTDASHLAANGWMQVALTHGSLFIKADGTTEYRPTNGDSAGDSFSYTVTDGSAESNTATVTLNVQLNAAPTLADTALSLTVAEDAGTPVGAVGSLIGSFTGGISDSDIGALKGIAVTGADASQGSWYYTLDGGANWQTVGTVSSTSALLLADNSNTRLYFKPNANFNGTVSSGLTFKAWDQTSWTAGSKVDSTSSSTFVIPNSGAVLPFPSMQTVSGMTGNLTDVNLTLGGLTHTFPDDLDILLVGPQGQQVLLMSDTGGGAGVKSINLTFDDAAATLLADSGPLVSGSFKPTNFDAPDSFTGISGTSFGSLLSVFNGTDPNGIWSLYVNDDMGMDAGTIGSWTLTLTTANGSQSFTVNPASFSTATDTISVTVTPVNDAPVANGTATLASISEDTINPPGDTVSNLFASRFSDTTDQVSGGSSANTLTGVAITGHAVDTTKGNWQYSTDGGSSWTTLNAISGDSSALTLQTSAKLRFVPTADYNGAAPGLTVRLIETPQAVSNAATLDASSNGGTTSISAATVLLGTTVTAVSDAPVLDLDANDSSTATGADYQTRYTENGTGVAIVDTDVGTTDVDNANLASATIVLTNAKSGDLLSVGTLPSGITGVVDTSVAGQITITLTGSATQADYLTALRAVRFSNTSDAPDTTARRITVKVNDGAVDSNVGATTIMVTPVNDAPAGASATLTVLEDGSKTFAASDFGFSDASDSPAHGLRAVLISTLPGAGTLQLDGVAVTRNQSIALANLGQLVYAPAANANGTGYASFTFQVQDSGGTTNGGIDLDPSPNTITFNVTAVNDAPTASGSTTLVADLEDTAAGSVSTATVGSLFANNFSDSADQVSGGSSANTLAGIAISGYSADATKGSWQYSSDGTNWSTLSSISGAATALTLKAADQLRFVPAADFNGAAPSLTVKLIDSSAMVTTGATVDATGGGTSAYSLASVLLGHSITAVSDDFSDANETVNVLEDSSNHTGHLLTGTNSVDGPVTVKSFSLA
ncbi:Ig-like domain-containing protein, partial [Malikia sp.]|uniref:beta strand repeat-containing protein n=1 Tax=Malikia sp. TaxID=2070706 RepID=UPI0026194209